MNDSNEITSVDLSSINTKLVMKVIGFIVFGVIGFYLVNFHYGLSIENGDWGMFGDYFGGILNPIVALFAFYLISETYKLQIKAYELQERELEATRRLLEVSTDAQKDQIKLAALTALLNSNLTRIGLLKSEEAELLRGKVIDPQEREKVLRDKADEYKDNFNIGCMNSESYDLIIKIDDIDSIINNLAEKNSGLEKQIEAFLK